MEPFRRAELSRIALSTAWLHEVLQTVREVGPPGAWVGAGAVRNTVWDVLTGRPSTKPYGDVDVVYWAAQDSEQSAGLHESRLRSARADIDWEVTNQATVHLWHGRNGQRRVAPHDSVQDGIASWPETATAVAIRLAPDGTVEILAPFGLADLFALRLRHNPTRAGVEVFRKRLADKRWLERWPELQLVAPAD